MCNKVKSFVTPQKADDQIVGENLFIGDTVSFVNSEDLH